MQTVLLVHSCTPYSPPSDIIASDVYWRLVPGRDITDQILPGREYFKYSLPATESLVSYILAGTGKPLNFFSSVTEHVEPSPLSPLSPSVSLGATNSHIMYSRVPAATAMHFARENDNIKFSEEKNSENRTE